LWLLILTTKYAVLVIRYISCTITFVASSFTRFLDHTHRHTTVGRTPLDE